MSDSGLRLASVLETLETPLRSNMGETFSPNNVEKNGNDKKTNQHVQELLQLWKRYTKTLPIDDPTVRNIAAELCALLIKTRSLDALAVFLDALPNSRDYSENESIVRAKIHVALNIKDTNAVYKLIENNCFLDGEDLIKIWDEAHYLDEEKRTKKELTPLSRFRVRKRYRPPKSVCHSGMRKTNTLPREATSYLKTWLINHVNDPYPSAVEKQQLAKVSGLSQAQVKTWFANARRRSKSTDEFERRCENHLPVTTSISSKPTSSPPLSPLPATYHNTENNQNCQHNGEGYQVVRDDCHSAILPHEPLLPYSNSYMERHGHNRHERGELFTYDPIPSVSCSGVRLCRPLEQPYYDSTARILINISTNGGYHHYDYPQSGGYYH